MLIWPYVFFTLLPKSYANDDDDDYNVKEFKIKIQWQTTSRIESDGQMLVQCLIPKTTTFNPNSHIELHNEDTGAIVASKKPLNFKGYFAFLPNDTRIYGKLRCRLEGRWTTNSKTVVFQFCWDRDQKCQESGRCSADNDDSKFCFYTSEGAQPCGWIGDKSWCDVEQNPYLFCPVKEHGICKATFVDFRRTWFMMMPKRTCPDFFVSKSKSPLSYKGDSVYYGKTIVLNQSEPYLLFECPVGSPFYDKEVGRMPDIEGPPLQIPRSPCRGSTKIGFEEQEFTNGIQYFETSFFSGNVEFTFAFKAVIFGTELEMVKVNDTDPDRNLVTCRFTSLQAHQGKKWLTKKSDETKIFNKKEHGQNWSFAINYSDEYQCHAEITLKACSPHRIFSHTFKTPMVYRQHFPDKSSADCVYLQSNLQSKVFAWVFLLGLVTIMNH